MMIRRPPNADQLARAMREAQHRNVIQNAVRAVPKALARERLVDAVEKLQMKTKAREIGTALRERLELDAERRNRLQPESQPWRVEWGQTLAGIANTLQQQGVQGTIPEIINQICEMNGIENPDLIYAGSTLNVPTTSTSAPTEPTPTSEARDVPYISQMNSNGTEDDWNASSNCGPTSMAMIARAFGFGGGMSDGALVNSLGSSAGVGVEGTGYVGIQTMASSLGLQSEAHAGSDVSWIDAQLAEGNLVAANGDRGVTLQNESPPYASGSASGGHWIVVCGKTPDGNYIVQDPSTTCRVLTPSELSRFLATNAHGGYAVSISPP